MTKTSLYTSKLQLHSMPLSSIEATLYKSNESIRWNIPRNVLAYELYNY